MRDCLSRSPPERIFAVRCLMFWIPIYRMGPTPQLIRSRQTRGMIDRAHFPLVARPGCAGHSLTISAHSSSGTRVSTTIGMTRALARARYAS